MFADCTNLIKLDLSNFNISHGPNAKYMFSDCKNLKYIKCTEDFKNWCIKLKLIDHEINWEIV